MLNADGRKAHLEQHPTATPVSESIETTPEGHQDSPWRRWAALEFQKGVHSVDHLDGLEVEAMNDRLQTVRGAFPIDLNREQVSASTWYADHAS